MGSGQGIKESNRFLDEIKDYVAGSSGLTLDDGGSEGIQITQVTDGKSIPVALSEISEILTRNDKDGESFLQVNFRSGQKILITESLVGFKPIPFSGIEEDKLPKVVTTPDLLSVFEAVEEAINTDGEDDEIEMLKKVYYSILCGGEAIGFNLAYERTWLGYLCRYRASA